MFRTGGHHMVNLNADQIRYAFLAAAYRELFGTSPDPDALVQLTLESNKNGKQRP